MIVYQADHQGRGIGTELMRRLLDLPALIGSIDPTCDPGLQSFYRRYYHGSRRCKAKLR